MTQFDFTYRKAAEIDIPDIVQLTLRAYQDHQAALSPADWERMHANLSNKHLFIELLGRATAFVCEIDDVLAGVIFLLPSGNPTIIFPADWSYIRLLGVDPGYRKLGIGRKLTELCIDRARSTGEIAVALHTSEFMSAARTMYEELGFREQRELALSTHV